MVFKRMLSILLIVILSLCVVVFPCSAHPGRTDSKGGHYDHDTGEYHYHNDGSPQNIPQYGSNGATKEYNTTVTRRYNSYNYNSYDDIDYSTEIEEKKSNNGYIVYIVISIIAFIILVSAVLVYRSDSKDSEKLCNRLKSDISELKSKQKLLEAENIRAEKKIKFLQEKLTAEKKYDGETVAELIGVPTGSIIGEDNLPREENAVQFWGEKYTFYVSCKGNKYHKRSCHHAKTATPTNAYTLRRRDCHPCYSCNPILPDMKWVDKHLEIKAFKDKHNENNDPSIKINYRNK